MAHHMAIWRLGLQKHLPFYPILSSFLLFLQKKKTMIQRIQSVYLFFALIITGSLFYLDMAELANPENSYSLTYKGVITIGEASTMAMPALALYILLLLAIVITGATIFLYKKRMLQIRLCALNLGLHAGLSVMIFYFAKMAAKELQAELSFNWPLILPLISLILIFLAMRSIGKDEALIRSLNRIR